MKKGPELFSCIAAVDPAIAVAVDDMVHKTIADGA